MCFSRVELRWAVSTRGKNTFSLVPGAQSWFEFRFWELRPGFKGAPSEVTNPPEYVFLKVILGHFV